MSNKENFVSTYHRKLQDLATKRFKIQRNLSQDILREKFVPKISLYNLRRDNTFERCHVYSVPHSKKSQSYPCPKIWNLVPLELKQLERLEVLKLKIKQWIAFEYLYRLLRTYIQ